MNEICPCKTCGHYLYEHKKLTSHTLVVAAPGREICANKTEGVCHYIPFNGEHCTCTEWRP